MKHVPICLTSWKGETMNYYKVEVLKYLRNKRWNSYQLEQLVEDYEGCIIALSNAAIEGRIALMGLFDPYLCEEDCEVAADLICPLPEPPLR